MSGQRGDRFVLVTSGAVGLGCQRLGLKARPSTLSGLQAAAAIGQGHLMALYEEAMAVHGIPVAQVLLTRSDLADQSELSKRFSNPASVARLEGFAGH
jgi:glutamate 5-kinase